MESTKRPIRVLEHTIHKFVNVALPAELGRLNRHKENILQVSTWNITLYCLPLLWTTAELSSSLHAQVYGNESELGTTTVQVEYRENSSL